MSTPDEIAAAELRGAQQLLGSIRASLRGYPNAGGDIEIMQEIDRIVEEEVRKRLEGQNAV